jgi:hypothetical protein
MVIERGSEEIRYCLDCLEEVKQGKKDVEDLDPLPEKSGKNKSTRKYCDTHLKVRRSQNVTSARKTRDERRHANWQGHILDALDNTVGIDPLDV